MASKTSLDTQVELAERARDVTFAMCAGCLGNLLITPGLWLTNRFYPFTPVFECITPFPNPIDGLVYALLIALFLVLAASKNPRSILLLAASLCGVLALQDQSRWHPWCYWYFAIILALLSFHSDLENVRRKASAINMCRLLLCCAYFWGGLQKLNVAFIHGLFPRIISPVLTDSSIVAPLAIFIAIWETAVGLSLLNQRTRMLGVISAIVLHSSILLFLGPLGHATNSNVWPWNVTVAFLVYFLFARNSDASALDILVPRSFVHVCGGLLFGILPLFTFFNLFDTYPGFSLWSGSHRSAYFEIDENAKQGLPLHIANYLDGNILPVSKWALGELNTPEYAEVRIYKRLLWYLCSQTGESPGIRLIVLAKPDRRTGVQSEELKASCELQ